MSDYKITLSVEDNNTVIIEPTEAPYIKRKLDIAGLRLETIRMFANWLDDNKITKREEVRVIGRHLFEALFGTEGRDVLNREWAAASEENKRLRIQLRFDSDNEEARKLEILPWEFLYHPELDAFLAIDDRFVLSRYMPPKVGERRLPTMDPEESPLKILIVDSQPEELTPILANPVIEAIEQLKNIVNVQIDRVPSPTLDQWHEKLHDFNPHVIHWMGHGRYNREDNHGEIAFVDENRKLYWCPDELFAQKFSQMRPRPRLVVLQACETTDKRKSTSTLSDSFSGVAPWLVTFQIPAVVAMQYPITQKAAIVFSKSFYTSLAKGEEVDDAFQTARTSIISASWKEHAENRIFGTPILYWRSRNGIIFPETPALENSRQPARPISDSSAATSWTAEAQAIMRVGEEEMKILNLDESEKWEIYPLFYPIVKKCASFNNLIEIKQKLSEELPSVSNTKLRKIILKMIDATKEIA